MEQEKQSSETKSDQKTEELDFNTPDFSFTAKSNHEWRQRGYFLICYSCELQHAVFVGGDKILTGFESDGTPILSKKLILK